MAEFDYDVAFSRSIGWVTRAERERLRRARVAIAGLGGVGGSHLITLTRLGIGAFSIADPDVFELANFNRQAGASLKHVGRRKVDVLRELALDINPELDLRCFDDGVTPANLDAFFAGVDVYVDGLDFFAVPARQMAFAACARRGIPATTAAPLGMGSAVLNFVPGGMTFEEYFQLDGQTEEEQLLRFLMGLSPAMLQMPYLVDPSAADLIARRGPSTPMACELCAGLAATQVLKMVLGRGRLLAAPWGLHVDAYRNCARRTWRPGGNRHPLQRVGLAIARRGFQRIRAQRLQLPEPGLPVLHQILDAARWAPSGDNMQGWRFEIRSERRVVVHATDTREHCVYDLEGHASLLAFGALLETMRIAATGHGLSAQAAPIQRLSESRWRIEVGFEPDSSLARDPLIDQIRVRAVQRRAMRTRPLSAGEKSALQAALGPGHVVHWVESFGERLRLARLLFANAGIRLTLPEAYETHRSVIEWNAEFSLDRIPDRAVGLDALALRLMRWAMQDWSRVEFLNRYLGGTLLPRLQLDFIPGLACAAHFVLLGTDAPQGPEDYLAGGRAWQRFWLTGTALGLWQQPEMTPLIFGEYVRNGVDFTRRPEGGERARRLAARLLAMFGDDIVARALVMGRIGAGPAPIARSLRLPLAQLLLAEAPVATDPGE